MNYFHMVPDTNSPKINRKAVKYVGFLIEGIEQSYQ